MMTAEIFSRCVRYRKTLARHLLARLPHLLRRRRHLDRLAAAGNSVRERIHHRRDRRRGAGLASALDAERVRGRWHLVDLVLEHREVVPAWPGLIHERGAEKLAAVVIH